MRADGRDHQHQAMTAEQFEQSREHLHAVAYRMLGSSSEADDAVQECWLRLSGADTEGVANLRGWLTTVIGRICLDMLRSRRARREEGGTAPVLELVVSADPADDPAEQAELADSVGLALLVVLDTLTPAERLAFVLHDMFAVPFDEIGAIVERTPTATRQLASRARRRVRGAVPPDEVDLAKQRRVVDAFLAAARAGDFEALLDVLDPDVVLRTHTGPADPRARPPAVGRGAVAEAVLSRGRQFAPLAQPVMVNGAVGLMVVSGGQRLGVVGFSVSDGRVLAIDLVIDPERLRKVEIHG